MALQLRVISQLQKAFGYHSNNTNPQYYKDEVMFWCPFCKLEHYKTKLTIKIDDESEKFGNWKCWNCEISNNTKGNNIITLLKKLNAPIDLIDETKTILNSIGYNSNIQIPSNHIEERTINLPNEYISFYDGDKSSFLFKKAFNYLIRRGLAPIDIVRYNLGYCESGKYTNHIIVPSYDKYNKLNYFVARSFINKNKINAPYDRSTIIPFESYINWQLPLYITEGVFDAIALRRNAVPLLTKYISNLLYETILINKTPEIIFILDSDAINTSIKYVNYFLNNDIKVKLIDLNKYNIKDAGSSNFKELTSLYYKTPYMTETDLLKIKLKRL